MPTSEPGDIFLHCIKTTDQQSLYLVEALDRFYLDAARGNALPNLASLVDRLADYAVVYLYLVENLYSTSACLVKYEAEYAQLQHKVDELKKAYYIDVTIRLSDISFFINWLTHNRLGRYAYALKQDCRDKNGLCDGAA